MNFKDFSFSMISKRERENIESLYGKHFDSLAKDVYNDYPLAEEMYGTWENYASKVFNFYIHKNKQPVYGTRVTELPDEQIPFDRTPYYNLEELVQETIKLACCHTKIPKGAIFQKLSIG